MAERALDVIAIGRVSVDLYGQQIGGRLEDMASFAKYVGGCPANIAVGAARLGLKSALLSRVGDEHMGRFVREQLMREGVDTSHLATDPRRLTALVILGIRDRETFPLIFYRENCADMALEDSDVSGDFIGSARALVVTGTHFSTPGVAAASRNAMTLAEASGAEIILDIDYRPVLWGLGGHGTGEVRFVDSAAVTRHLQPLLSKCDVIVGTEEEFHIAGGDTDTMRALGRVRELSEALLVLKRGAQGAVAFPAAIPKRLEDGVWDRGFPVEVYNVLGAGDAFMAGFLRGHLTGASLPDSLRMANGCGALVVSRHGCAPAMATWPELRHLMDAGSSHRALRHDPALNHLHWSTTRRSDLPELTVLAFDHRVQLERMADQAGQSHDRIPQLKQLIYRAGRQVAGADRSFGIIVDDRYGQDVLDQASGLGHFIARPIELPETTPLHFEGQPDVGVTLAEWPVDHVAKCLVKMHPGDPIELQAAQHRQLEILFNACRSTGHELLLEVVPSRGAANDGVVLAATLSQLYGLGIRPDWWKLAGPDDNKGWQAIADAIGNGDPYCRGVVLLGLDAPEQAMAKTLGLAAEQPICKGFAIGRTIIGEAAADWLGERIDDDTAVARMAAIYRRLIEAWRDASSARRQSA